MNWQHLTAFLWLRWRLLANGWRRGGRINFIITAMFAACAVMASVPLFAGSLWLGMYRFAEVSPVHLLYAWDALTLAFVCVWSVGLLTELQRTESLALCKFLHLPVSLEGAFVINYLSSLLSLTTILFVPVMFGFALGLAFSKGILLLWALPLVAAFLLMATALSYQFQGWLASLMSNPRRRRAVIVGVTTVFVLIAQLPNLLNLVAPWGPRRQIGRFQALAQEMEQLDRDFEAQKIGQEQYSLRQQELLHEVELAKSRMEEGALEWQRAIRMLNWLLPIGWLPLGVVQAAEGNVLVPLLALFCLTAIGAGSLWRSYRTTLRLYQGQFTASTGRTAPATASAAPAPAVARTSGTQLLELRLPGLSESVSVIALAGFRSLLRSPEARMMLLTPVLMSVVAGGAMLRQANAFPLAVRPLMGIGAMFMVLFGMMQLMVNQFGFDREGFRVFVLCAASRREILLGKNLAFLPLAAAMAAFLLAVLQFVCPLRLDHLAAMLPQFISMYLLFCAFMNMLSIYTPIYLAAGSLKPASPKASTVLVQMVTIMIFLPLIQLPTFLPWGIEVLAEQFGWASGVPIFLSLAVAECAAMVFLSRWVLRWQGRLLQAREQTILEVVTKPAS